MLLSIATGVGLLILSYLGRDRTKPVWIPLLTAACGAAAIAAGVWAEWRAAEDARIREQEKARMGRLIPGDRYSGECADERLALTVHYGANVMRTAQRKADLVVAGSKPLLSISRRPDSSIEIVAEVFSRDEILAARIEENDIYLPDQKFLFARPSYSSLVVLDHTGGILLFVNLLNHCTLQFVGEFNAPGFFPTSVTKHTVGRQTRVGVYQEGGTPIVRLRPRQP